MPYERSPRPLVSTTIGTSPSACASRSRDDWEVNVSSIWARKVMQWILVWKYSKYLMLDRCGRPARIQVHTNRTKTAQKNGVRAVAPTAGTPLQRRLRLRRCACQFFEAHFLVRHLGLAQHEFDDVRFNDVRFHFSKTLLVRIIPADDFLRVFVAFREFVDFCADLLRLCLQVVSLHQLCQHETQLDAALGLFLKHSGRNRRIFSVRHAALLKILARHCDETLLV